MNRKLIGICLILIIIFISSIFYFSRPPKINEINIDENVQEQKEAASNIIENVEYPSKDTSGNEYTIKAIEGETDINNTNIIFLKNVSAIIELKNSNKILILADFG